MADADLQRISAFEEQHARAQASEIRELGWGYALLQSDFDRSHDHNRVVVTAAAPVGEIIATAEQVLGEAGLRHRYVTVVDDATGLAMAPELAAAGFAHEPIATMMYRGPGAVPPAKHSVIEMAPAEIRSALIRDWRREIPEADEVVYEQLADRTTLYGRGLESQHLAVIATGEVAARANLFVDRPRMIAQFENLFTSVDHRGHGYARSLMREALRLAADDNCEICFLTADLDDWPYQWYRRLGFVEVTRTHHFTLSAE